MTETPPFAAPAAEVRVTRASDDDLVTATVAGGRLAELRLDPRIMRKDSEALAELVRRTVDDALGEAADAAAELARAAVPALPDAGDLAGLLGGLQATAGAKLDEITAALDDLTRRGDVAR